MTKRKVPSDKEMLDSLVNHKTKTGFQLQCEPHFGWRVYTLEKPFLTEWFDDVRSAIRSAMMEQKHGK